MIFSRGTSSKEAILTTSNSWLNPWSWCRAVFKVAKSIYNPIVESFWNVTNKDKNMWDYNFHIWEKFKNFKEIWDKLDGEDIRAVNAVFKTLLSDPSVIPHTFENQERQNIIRKLEALIITMQYNYTEDKIQNLSFNIEFSF